MTLALDSALVLKCIWIDIALAILSYCINAGLIIFILVAVNEAYHDYENVNKTALQATQAIFIAVLALGFLDVVLLVALDLYLRRSVIQRNYRGCKIYIIISILLLIPFVLDLIINGRSALGWVIVIIVRLGVCAFAYMFMQELERGQGGQNAVYQSPNPS